jgi:hypothetical protein
MPVASFTSEGCFTPAEDFPWTAVAESELEEHLNRLQDESISFETVGPMSGS